MRHAPIIKGKAATLLAIGLAAFAVLAGASPAFAQSNASDSLITKFGTYIVNPLLLLIFAAGFFMFMYGLLEFMIAISRNSEDTTTGKQHMIYGTLGMFIMVSVYGIIALLDSTFGLNLSNPSANTNVNVPTINLFGGQ